MKKFILIDGNAFMHRAFHALPKVLKLPSGQLVNAVYGFASFLIHVLKTEDPDYIAVTFDHKEPTLRHQEYKEYKAKRVKAPDEFYAQIPLIKELIGAFNIEMLEYPGYESDDLIAALSYQVRTDPHLKTIIYTGDHDMLQLVNDRVIVALPVSGLKKVEYFDHQKIVEKYGFEPRQIIDYKALRGDPSDNIPGVKGIGEKSAVKLLNQYHSLENIYEHLSEIDQKIAAKLASGREDAFFSKKLATLIHDIDTKVQIADLSIEKTDWEKALGIIHRFNFQSLAGRVKELAHLHQKSAEIESENQMKLF